MRQKKLRVLVVDDTVTYRKIVSDGLAGMIEIEVVGTASNGKIALDKIERLRPDVVTLDLEMPVMGGLEVLQHLKQSGSEVEVIVLSGTSQAKANTAIAALELGAFDFVTKGCDGTREENTKRLLDQIRLKLSACSRRKQTPVAGGPTPAIRPASSSTDNIHMRMKKIATGSGRVDVVAIGISTGGPQALDQMLPRLPANLKTAVLVVQHMPPVFTKSLADDLNKRCSLEVSEAFDGQVVEPGHIIIAPGGKQMKVTREEGNTVIRITDDPRENSCRPSVDYLFRSVTQVYGANALGVIMTGMGSDGAEGCRQMKQEGATILAQDEESCVVFGMPRLPITEGIADVVCPLAEIADEIDRMVGRSVVSCR